MDGEKRSFISTGCVPFDDCDAPTFQAYSKHNICGSMKIVPTGTVDHLNDIDNINNNDIVVDETSSLIPEINFMLEYDNAILEHDREITEAMNFIDNL